MMYRSQPDNSKQKAFTAIVVLLAIVLVTVSVKAYDNKQKQPLPTSTSLTFPSTTQTTNSATSTTSPNTTSTSSSYKDGSYSATSDYYVPHGAESIQVSVTVKNGVVVGASVQNSESNPESAGFQEEFAASYKNFVVGKNISGLRISNIAGASDTAQGFNSALEQIQTQAQA